MSVGRKYEGKQRGTPDLPTPPKQINKSTKHSPDAPRGTAPCSQPTHIDLLWCPLVGSRFDPKSKDQINKSTKHSQINPGLRQPSLKDNLQPDVEMHRGEQRRTPHLKRMVCYYRPTSASTAPCTSRLPTYQHHQKNRPTTVKINQ